MLFNLKKRKTFAYILIFIVTFFCASLLYAFRSYQAEALILLTSILVSLLALLWLKLIRFFSLESFFIILMFIFHCGQLIKVGFSIKGDIPFDFRNYGNEQTTIQSLFFYLFSQSAVFLGMIWSCEKNINANVRGGIKIDVPKTALLLILIGFLPRIYIDFTQFFASLSEGYSGVYSLYIPQPVHTVAFFCDIGLILALLNKHKNYTFFLFYSVLLYKILMMTTGARQEKIAFLIVWIFIYFFVNQNFKIKNIVIPVLLFGVLIFTTYIIGETRNNISSAKEVASIFNLEKMIGDFLGEFGSALCTLEVPIERTGEIVDFGLGKSYIAGFFSIIPLLVSRIGNLSGETIFLSKFAGTRFLGGSFLGEAFYNFGWFGLFVPFLVGFLFKRCVDIVRNKALANTLKYILSIIIIICLILFIRGYFTDFIQKIVWVWAFVLITRKITFKEKADLRYGSIAIN